MQCAVPTRVKTFNLCGRKSLLSSKKRNRIFIFCISLFDSASNDYLKMQMSCGNKKTFSGSLN